MVRGVVVLLRDGEELARWPLDGDGDVDLGTVAALARLVLQAKRLDYDVRVEHLCPRVRELVELVGLVEVLG